MRKLSFQIALGGIISALCIILMFSVGLFPILVYAFPMISSLLIFALAYECGNKTALASYVSVSLLSIILSPDKESALLFLSFFGYYPILSTYLDRIKSRLIQWIIRLAVFNAAMAVSYYILIKVLVAVPIEEFGMLTIPVFLLIGNILLVLYEKMIRSMQILYVRKLRKKIFKRK